MRGIVNQVLERLLDSSTGVSSTGLARAAGISRQAAHKHLVKLVEAGALVSEGKARACRYRRSAATNCSPAALLAVAPGGPGARAAPASQPSRARPEVTAALPSPLSRLPPSVADSPAPLRTRLEVDSAGSQFRLSARLLLDGVEAGEVTLDFTGVADVAEEFLEEVFVVWAAKHPRATLRVAHFPQRHAHLLLDLARRRAEEEPVTGLCALGSLLGS